MAVEKPSSPLKIGIIGAGPSGFYVADSLFKTSIPLTIDIFDRLPTPFGLLRAGIAPDHQKMKSVRSYYHRIIDKNRDNFRFFGNVTIGKDISISTLQDHYDALFFCYGAETDKPLNIPNIDIKGSYTATAFVGWYNGHPDYQHLKFDLSQKEVAIIGLGNVAIDVARILGKTPEELSSSDITQNALDALKNASITDIHLIGRRGPVQAAFTHHEIEELGTLEACNIHINPDDLTLSPTDETELKDSNKAQKNIDALRHLAALPKTNKPKTIHLHFKKSPKELFGEPRCQGMILAHTTLTGPPGQQKATTTDQTSQLNCGIVFRSIGYKGLPLEGLPFDEKKGIIPNQKGRITTPEGKSLPGLYAAGWIKRGPIGVLGSNKPGAKESVECFVEDLETDNINPNPDAKPIDALLTQNNIRYITYEEWEVIDQEEERRGQSKGKPREKFTSTQDIIDFLDQS